MHARVSMFESPADNLGEGEQVFRKEIGPTMQEMKGCRGVMLVDGQSGKSRQHPLGHGRRLALERKKPSSPINAA